MHALKKRTYKGLHMITSKCLDVLWRVRAHLVSIIGRSSTSNEGNYCSVSEFIHISSTRRVVVSIQIKHICREVAFGSPQLRLEKRIMSASLTSLLVPTTPARSLPASQTLGRVSTSVSHWEISSRIIIVQMSPQWVFPIGKLRSNAIRRCFLKVSSSTKIAINTHPRSGIRPTHSSLTSRWALWNHPSWVSRPWSVVQGQRLVNWQSPELLWTDRPVFWMKTELSSIRKVNAWEKAIISLRLALATPSYSSLPSTWRSLRVWSWRSPRSAPNTSLPSSITISS